MYEEKLELAKTAAKKAGDFLRQKEEIKLDSLTGKDIKISADKICEQIIIKELLITKLPILSEENGYIGDKNDLYWIIDPIDGTFNYYRNIDEMVCISIALWLNNSPILGVIYRFATNDIYYGIVGKNAYMNNDKIRTTSLMNVEQAVLGTGFPVKRSYETNSLLRFLKKIQIFKKIRMFGSAAMTGAYLACGKIDAYIEDEIMLWDIAAAAAIIIAAGGICEIEILPDYKCNCNFYSSSSLKEDFSAKSL